MAKLAPRSQRVTILTGGHARIFDTRGPSDGQPATAPRSVRRDADELADELAGISTAISLLRRLRGKHADDRTLQEQLDAATDHLEAIGRSLLDHRAARDQSGPSGGSSDLPQEGDPTTVWDVSDTQDDPPDEGDVEAFLTWLTFHSQGEHLAASSRPDAALRRFLLRLTGSSRILPGGVSSQLRLPAGSTVGDAARALLRAVHDPQGPRCPSYAEAIRRLQR